ncbi:hypothetical protein HDU96_005289 [Phlyctochytrium bullatum]|nr:hypothetical protein HDU96_005289 [Phlyctochytrium bullatum]
MEKIRVHERTNKKPPVRSLKKAYLQIAADLPMLYETENDPNVLPRTLENPAGDDMVVGESDEEEEAAEEDHGDAPDAGDDLDGGDVDPEDLPEPADAAEFGGEFEVLEAMNDDDPDLNNNAGPSVTLTLSSTMLTGLLPPSRNP